MTNLKTNVKKMLSVVRKYRTTRNEITDGKLYKTNTATKKYLLESYINPKSNSSVKQQHDMKIDN